jgi:hypothetical protein
MNTLITGRTSGQRQFHLAADGQSVATLGPSLKHASHLIICRNEFTTAARIGGGGAYRFLMRRHEGRRPLERPRRRWV